MTAEPGATPQTAVDARGAQGVQVGDHGIQVNLYAAQSKASLAQMAVYYPYIHFRDASWLKVAALYWPRMVRIVDPDYPTRNSPLVEVLQGELDFVIDHSPAVVAREMAGSFIEFVHSMNDEHLSAWRKARELPPPAEPLEAGEHDCVPPLEFYAPKEWIESDHLTAQIRAGALAGVHASEVAPELATVLQDAELAVLTRGDWFAMHPQLAWMYKCRLAEELARRNQLVTTTDQLSAHAVMAAPLESGGGAAGGPTIADALGLLSIVAVVPGGIDRVPVEKIVEVRQRFGGEFARWRAYIDAVGADLAEQLTTVESPTILDAYLSEAVNRYAKAPVQDLRRGLVDVGLHPTDLAVNSKFDLPATALLAQPQLAVADGVALGTMRLRRAADAPSAYLLSIQETFEPRTWLQRVIHAIRRAGGLST